MSEATYPSQPDLGDAASSAIPWPVLHLSGLTPDVLGNYLASMGLLAIVARDWPGVRGCWRGEQFVLVNGPADRETLIVFLTKVAVGREWSPYDGAWGATQKKDTKAKNATSTSLWRAAQAAENELPLFQSHIALGDRLSFNPLLGSGGNAGQRSFSSGLAGAVAALAKPKANVTRPLLTQDLDSFLMGNACVCLGDFNAASWFSAANKAYNSGTEKPFRKGKVTPWAMALACEGLSLLQGATSRRLGAHRGALGAFPFATRPAAPESAGEAGRLVAELWLPMWHRPMSLPELSTLFSRGRAEMHGKAASTAPAFSVAIIQRGVDAGIDEFRRFALIRTTSENTFESRLAAVVPVRGCRDTALERAVDVALRVRDSLPPDRKKGKRWIYAGLRGPVDRALIELAAQPDSETSCALVDGLVTALRAVDRNRSHRERKIQFHLLPGAWARSLIGEHDAVSPEMCIAFALATLQPTSTPPPGSPKQITAPMLAYWLGAENLGRHWMIPKAVPLRRIWGGGDLAVNLASVLRRRLIEERPDAMPPFEGRLRVSLFDIEALIGGSVDDAELQRWLFRFSLFSLDQMAAKQMNQRLANYRRIASPSASVALFALFKPLFDSRLIQSKPIGASKATRVGTLSPIAALLACGDVSAAVEVARRAYRAVGVSLADFQCPFDTPYPKRLLAALLVPVQGAELARSFRQWRLPVKLNPQKEKQP